MKKLITFYLLLLLALPASAQTVIDMHSGRVTAKSRDDYNYKAREAWQLREDSIAYDDCITRAFNYLHEDSLQLAQTHFERALKLRPDARGNVVVRHNLARIFMARRQWKEAVTMYARVLEEQPRNAEAREERAECYAQWRQYEKALKDYEYLLMTRPDDAHYRLLHALMLSYTGRRLDAIDELDALIDADDTNANYYITRAGVYLDLGNKGYARRDLDRAVALGASKDELLELYQQLK